MVHSHHITHRQEIRTMADECLSTAAGGGAAALRNQS
jgi:hypothetical protein